MFCYFQIHQPFTVFDGDDDSNVESRVVNIGSVNDAPVLSTIEAIPAIYTENTVGTGITGNLSISDVDDTQIESATVTISNPVGSGDALSFVSQFGITGSYSNGTLLLSGSASLAQYEAVIHSVVYSNLGENPSTATRTVEIVVNDGSLDSNSVFRDIEVVAVNDAPVLTSIEGLPASHTENGPPTGITGNLSIGDVDDGSVESATVTISNYVANEDVLSFVSQFGITGDYANGVLSLSGSASLAQYEAVIHSVAYSNLRDNPSGVARTVEIVVNDGDVNSAPVFRDIEIIPVNDAPVVLSIETSIRSYLENSGPTVISSMVSLSDVDDVNIDSATVQISGNYTAGEDILSLSGSHGVTGIWDPLTGTLTIRSGEQRSGFK